MLQIGIHYTDVLEYLIGGRSKAVSGRLGAARVCRATTLMSLAFCSSTRTVRLLHAERELCVGVGNIT